MFDIGMLELLVIGIVALIVIGPKDLPGMFQTLGRFTAKARSMAREFTSAMEDAAKESGVNDIAKDINTVARPGRTAMKSFKDAATRFEDWDPMKSSSKPAGDKKEMGPNTQALSEERAEAASKIHKATAKKAEARIAREKAAETGAAKPAKTAAKKPAAKKPAAKTAAKPAAKPAAKTAPKPAAKPAASGTRKKPAAAKKASG